MPANLFDATILTDFAVYVADDSYVGQIPSFQPPDIQIMTESFRGGGMDGEVEIPFGIEKIDFEFDLHTWDANIWSYLGYGPGSMNTPIRMVGSMISPSMIGANAPEIPVEIYCRALVKAVKIGKIEAGKKVEMTVSVNCNAFRHTIDGEIVTEVDLFRKKLTINGVDRTASARANLLIGS